VANMTSKETLLICFGLVTTCILSGVAVSDALLDCGYENCYVVNNSAERGPGSLEEALALASTHNNSVEIRLVEGTFQLPGNNNYILFQEWSNFSIVGTGPTLTILECNGSMGLYFNRSRDIKFLNISISSCGFVFITTSVNLTTLDGPTKMSYLKSQTALLFESCSNLFLENAEVSFSVGTGITIYNTDGHNVFRKCDLVHNNYEPTVSLLPGGGGIVVETSHCYPGDTSCQDNSSVVKETRDASYLFEQCKFLSNHAYSKGAVEASIPHGWSHMELGKGGGLSITLKGQAYHNDVIIRKCDFQLNFAESGGGLHASFGDRSINNSVAIFSSNFESNNPNIFNTISPIIGGAARITMVTYREEEGVELWNGYVNEVSGNSVSFTDTMLNGNFASWGGAVSFATTRNTPNQTLSNSLSFSGCYFMNNRAILAGSGIDLSSWKPEVIGTYEPYMIPIIKDCHFISNKISFKDISNHRAGLGAVYVEGLPVEYVGVNIFSRNSDTALVVSSTFIKVSNSSVLNFTNNHGRRGGALAFIGEAWMVVGENSRIEFRSNSVGDNGYGLGGAVYAVHFGDHDLKHRQDCFFQYYKFGVTPQEWNATFYFSGNSANKENNSIYTTSRAPCVWSENGFWSEEPEKNAFCQENTWVFEGEERNCHNEISTGPSQIEVPSVFVDAVPGWSVNLNVSTLDDYSNIVKTALVASVTHGSVAVASDSIYILDDKLTVYGNPTDDSFNNLLLMTPDPRVVASTLRINVLDCPVGFRPVNCKDKGLSNYTCNCMCHTASGLSCSNVSRDVFISKYNCASVANATDGLLDIARCPYNQNRRTSLKGVHSANLSEYICGMSNREGGLCSSCKPGFGVNMNSYYYKCVECKNSEKYNWVLFLLIELGPISIICFSIVMFGINLASPYMNAFIFFSQIVSVKYFHNSFCWVFGGDYIRPGLSKPITLLYGIWNLDFFREFVEICLHEKLDSLNVLLINYIKALYPMVVLLFCYVCIKLYDRNVRLIQTLWKPLRYCRKTIHGGSRPSTTIINSFTTLLILSYTKILYVSFPLVAFITVYTTNKNGTVSEVNFRYYYHADVAVMSGRFFYFIIGVITLILLVGLPLFLLLLYSCSYFQIYCGRISVRLRIIFQIFGDSFLGGFKNGTNGSRDYRWFGGAYLIFRVVVFAVYVSEPDWLVQYVVQQVLCTLGIFLFAVARPYKADYFNYLDVSFFVLLSILNSLSMYNSQIVEKTNIPNAGIFYLNYILMYLPLVYLMYLIFYFLLLERVKRWLNKSRKMTKGLGEQTSYDSDDEVYEYQKRLSYDHSEELPDRLLHPDEYDSLKPMAAVNNSATEKKKRSRKVKTDKSFFAKDRNQDGQAKYGSIGVQSGLTAPL